MPASSVGTLRFDIRFSAASVLMADSRSLRTFETLPAANPFEPPPMDLRKNSSFTARERSGESAPMRPE